MFKTLPGDEVRDFTLINFGEYFKYTGEKLLSKLKEKKNLTRVAGLFVVF